MVSDLVKNYFDMFVSDDVAQEVCSHYEMEFDEGINKLLCPTCGKVEDCDHFFTEDDHEAGIVFCIECSKDLSATMERDYGDPKRYSP